jgi:hypothetical protein
MVYRAARAEDAKDTVELRFRDPAIFQARLKDLSNSDDVTVTTQVAPGGDTTQRNPDGSVKRGRSVTEQDDQRLSVSQLIPPKLCNRGAQTDDLLEISYVGRVLETGSIFDGSAVKINGEGIAGRGNDVSIFFVLGKQPFGSSYLGRVSYHFSAFDNAIKHSRCICFFRRTISTWMGCWFGWHVCWGTASPHGSTSISLWISGPSSTRDPSRCYFAVRCDTRITEWLGYTTIALAHEAMTKRKLELDTEGFPSYLGSLVLIRFACAARRPSRQVGRLLLEFP